MSSAVKVILGVSVLAMGAGFAACDNGGSDTGGGPTVVTAGTGNGTAGGGTTPGGAGASTAGGGAPGTAGTSSGAGAGALPEGVPLDPMDGWVANTNSLMIQGAVFSYGDTTSYATTVSDFTGTNAHISGTAAKVDMASDPCKNMMFTAPATDCYGQYWGVAIGMNLNQAIDMTLTPPAGGTPAPFNASALKGFAFEVEGATVPAPAAFRFKVDNGTDEFCNVPTVKIKVGINTVLFTDMVKECYKTPVPTSPLATTIQTGMVKIAWQVVTNANATVPFDFSISNVRALLADGSSTPVTGTAGAANASAGASNAGAGAANASAGAASTAAGAGGASAGAASTTAGAGGSSAGTGGAAG